MRWIITHDYTTAAEMPGRSVAGTRSCATPRELDADELPARFRLYDDDGNCCFEGRADSETDFEPLDDFGTGYAGCTEIRYFERGRWARL